MRVDRIGALLDFGGEPLHPCSRARAERRRVGAGAATTGGVTRARLRSRPPPSGSPSMPCASAQSSSATRSKARSPTGSVGDTGPPCRAFVATRDRRGNLSCGLALDILLRRDSPRVAFLPTFYVSPFMSTTTRSIVVPPWVFWGHAVAVAGDLSVTALYTSQVWAWGGFRGAERLLATPDAKCVFDVTERSPPALRGRPRPVAAPLRTTPPPRDDRSLARHRSGGSGAASSELAAGFIRRGAANCAARPYTEPSICHPSVAKKRELLERTAEGRAVLEKLTA